MDPEGNQQANAPASGTGTVAPEDVVASAPAPANVKPRALRSTTRPKAGTHPNNVKKLRQSAMMSKAELARRAGVSPLTIDRVEAGCPCRMDTKRKILEALGLQPAAAKEVFPEIDLG
jgi:DNA-binding XRE family transcriptional regulator